MVAAVTTRKNGFAEMAYVGEKPWHGQGQRLEAGRTIEEWQVAAGMDWSVGRSRVRFGEGPNQRTIDDQIVLFRSDTKMPLGIVSDKYQVVQPKAVLEFFRDLVDGNGYQLNTAGTLFDGKRFWALASVGEEAVVTGHDRIGGFLLLSTSSDGTLSTTAKFTTVRVVCNNTLGMALRAGSANVVNVTHRSAFNAEGVKQQLGLARGSFREFMVAARALSDTPVSTVIAKEFVEELLIETKAVTAELPRETKPFKKIMELFQGLGRGATLSGSEGTMWGLLNGVTEYVDHHARAKSSSHLLDSALFGRGDALKTAAFEKALERV